jgi:hypothetical protein
VLANPVKECVKAIKLYQSLQLQHVKNAVNPLDHTTYAKIVVTTMAKKLLTLKIVNNYEQSRPKQ